MIAENWVENVLSFWFDELEPKDWFTQNDKVDTAIDTRFGGLYGDLKSAPPEVAGSDGRTILAAIIVLDQFPRNMFRGSAEAFGTDNLAAALSRSAVDAELDTELEDRQKSFLYMPLMHSESLADQERAVMLFKALGNEDGLKYAIEHRDVVAKFGRFPHRNRALGRENTPEEREYLKSATGYGQ